MDQRLRRAGTQTGVASNGCSTQRPFALFLIDCLNDLLMAIPLRVFLTSRNVLMRGRSEKSAARHGHAATIGVSLSGIGPLPSPCGCISADKSLRATLWGHSRPGLFASFGPGSFHSLAVAAFRFTDRVAAVDGANFTDNMITSQQVFSVTRSQLA
jgi:hypothetical protein